MRQLDFPILQQFINGKPLIYLDNAATTQKPLAVINAINNYYREDNASVHRGVHTLSARATQAYENARVIVQKFINAEQPHQIIFTKGTTEAINLVASSFGKLKVNRGDEVLISAMEHHANIVPWQMLCEQTGATLQIIPIFDDGSINLDAYAQLLNKRTRIVGLTHVSHVLGTINPVKQMIELAHQQGIPVLLDGAQAIAHLPVDVQDLDCDFYVFSGHKLYGPNGIGVLYGKSHWLESMPPYQTGGHMIKRVSFAKTEFGALPDKFEAGTPPVVETIGLGVAIEYLNNIGFSAILQHEQHLMEYTIDRLQQLPELRLLGSVLQRINLFSVVMDGVHAHDIATILDHDGIAVRAGHHCAMPLMEHFGVAASVRISLGLYNNPNDIDQLIQSLIKALRLLG